MYIFNQILKEVFYALSGSIVVFGLMEIFWSKLVLAYFNINWVLLLWLFNGILILAFNQNKIKDHEKSG
ncbi:hypothetical protein KAI92_04975 [Candidatus Parcubacteria bacterium]|nr:hypothetical protein [Candidatus Parcubacteria bacterium]